MASINFIHNMYYIFIFSYFVVMLLTLYKLNYIFIVKPISFYLITCINYLFVYIYIIVYINILCCYLITQILQRLSRPETIIR